jgi:hypothetical protein
MFLTALLIDSFIIILDSAGKVKPFFTDTVPSYAVGRRKIPLCTGSAKKKGRAKEGPPYVVQAPKSVKKARKPVIWLPRKHRMHELPEKRNTFESDCKERKY